MKLVSDILVYSLFSCIAHFNLTGKFKIKSSVVLILSNLAADE